MMIGSIMMLIAIEAARPERSKPRIRIQVAKMNRPARIDGSAVMASTTVRTEPAGRLARLVEEHRAGQPQRHGEDERQARS